MSVMTLYKEEVPESTGKTPKKERAGSYNSEMVPYPGFLPKKKLAPDMTKMPT